MGEIHTSSGKVKSILKILDELYPDAECSLVFHDPLQLLISTILSAQCTDERVNKVTPALFDKYRSAKAFAEAPLEQLEQEVKSTGFYHNKALAIRETCKILDRPIRREGACGPGGIGQTARYRHEKRLMWYWAMLLAFRASWSIRTLARVSARLGLTGEKDPDKIERDLMALIPKEKWIKFSHQLIQHGRRICIARKPKCSICPLRPQCIYGMDESTPKA